VQGGMGSATLAAVECARRMWCSVAGADIVT